MTKVLVGFVAVLAFSGLTACSAEQQANNAAVPENVTSGDPSTAPTVSAAMQPTAATALPNAPPRQGPVGCGLSLGKIEDRRGARAVGDVVIGMTLDEALAAIECRGPIEFKNPQYPLPKTVHGPSGPVDVQTQTMDVRVATVSLPKKKEFFMLHLAGPVGAQRVVGIEGRLDHSEEGLSDDQLLAKLDAQYGDLILQPQLSETHKDYAAFEPRPGSTRCTSTAETIDGCLRVSTVVFITGLPQMITVSTQDNDYWASFAAQ